MRQIISMALLIVGNLVGVGILALPIDNDWFVLNRICGSVNKHCLSFKCDGTYWVYG